MQVFPRLLARTFKQEINLDETAVTFKIGREKKQMTHLPSSTLQPSIPSDQALRLNNRNPRTPVQRQKEQQHLHQAAGTISREVLLTAISEQEHWAPGTKS